MNWLDRLEKHFGQWTIPQFPLFLAAANGLIYLLAQSRPLLIQKMVLDPTLVMAGEWWRLIMFLFVPPMMGPIWTVLWLLFVYQVAQSLESEWGEFKFLVFFLTGALATIAAALLVTHETLSNGPLYTTLFLAFATLYPDYQVLLFFIIPIKLRYLSWIVWAGVLFSFVVGSFATRVGIAASLVNYFLFFGPMIWEMVQLKLEVYKNRKRFKP